MTYIPLNSDPKRSLFEWIMMAIFFGTCILLIILNYND